MPIEVGSHQIRNNRWELKVKLIPRDNDPLVHLFEDFL